LAKPVGGSLPMGITVARDDIMSSLTVGEHSTTFGGNPLVCAAASAFLDVLKEERLVEQAEIKGAEFKAQLDGLKSKNPIIRETRGLGLMLAAEFRFDILNILLQAAKNGLLILDAGRNILRFLPPFVITSGDITQTISILDSVLKEGKSIVRD
jgi:acetylornithine/LysW-gamma-L-lysine aminotransferase